jgi:hypothetical protein
MRKTTLCFSALALGLSVIGAPTAAQAGNGKGPEIEHFDDEFTTEDEFLTEICGFTVMVDGDIEGTVRFWPNSGRTHVTERGSVVLSNPESGMTLTNWWRQNYQGQGSETFNDDGTLTITFDDKITGIPERWLDNDGKTLIKDSGYARFVGELVIDLGDAEDPFDDEIISFSEEIVTHGPHPILEGGLDPFLVCGFLS